MVRVKFYTGEKDLQYLGSCIFKDVEDLYKFTEGIEMGDFIDDGNTLETIEDSKDLLGIRMSPIYPFSIGGTRTIHEDFWFSKRDPYYFDYACSIVLTEYLRRYHPFVTALSEPTSDNKAGSDAITNLDLVHRLLETAARTTAEEIQF